MKYELIILGIIGFVFGAVLAYLSKKFAVKGDEKVEEVVKVLPRVNCGACGFASCRAFAEAVVKGKANPDKCKVGKEKTGEKIRQTLNIKKSTSNN